MDHSVLPYVADFVSAPAPDLYLQITGPRVVSQNGNNGAGSDGKRHLWVVPRSANISAREVRAHVIIRFRDLNQ